MIQKTWINLSTKNPEKSAEFFEKLGFELKTQFGVISAILNANTMITLVENSQFKEFAQKEVADTRTTAETVVVLQLDSREAVNRLVDNAISLSARESREPHENGPMFGRSFEDPDGHVWEIFFMAEE